MIDIDILRLAKEAIGKAPSSTDFVYHCKLSWPMFMERTSRLVKMGYLMPDDTRPFAFFITDEGKNMVEIADQFFLKLYGSKLPVLEAKVDA